MGLDAATPRAVDVIARDVVMGVLADLEADLARNEAELGRHESERANALSPSRVEGTNERSRRCSRRDWDAAS
jgi:hypothetical protein